MEGGEKFEVLCVNKQASLEVKLGGMTGEELGDAKITSKNRKFQANPELDVPALSFERVDEGIFAVNISKNLVYFKLVGIPRTFKTKTVKLFNPPGAVEISGSFTGQLQGSFNLDDDSSAIKERVTCTFSTVTCARKKMDLN